VAQAFARSYGDGVLRAPRALIPDDVATLPGLDGRKMSKSYGNTIALMGAPEVTARRVRRIVTDSTPPAAPKAPDTLLTLVRAFAGPADVAGVERGYREGGIGYGEVKALLAESLEAHVAPLRDAYRELLEEPAALEERLERGEAHAGARAGRTLRRAAEAMGL
jgi:tryptophanyl-tRNA synthetase